MEVVDVFCGIGGFCAHLSSTPENGRNLGIDVDDSMVRLWAANTGGKGVLANLWTDSVEWPPAHPNLHVHLSPPCTTLSKANCNSNATEGLDHIRNSLDLVHRQGYTSWSLETVSTPAVRTLVDERSVAYTVVDAADYGTPSTRTRIVAGTPDLIHRIRTTPVCRVSVREAMVAANMPLPSNHVKNTSRTRDNRSCVRSVDGPAHTQTASHPLMWCNADGDTVRCFTVAETAVIMGFPKRWLLPRSSRAAIRALGNAVPPPLAAAIFAAARNGIPDQMELKQ